jgi:hypothetical protein
MSEDVRLALGFSASPGRRRPSPSLRLGCFPRNQKELARRRGTSTTLIKNRYLAQEIHKPFRDMDIPEPPR